MTNSHGKKPIRVYFLSFSSVIARLLSGVAIGVVLVFLLPLVVSHVENAESYRFVRAALTMERALSTVVRANIPTKVGGKDITRWIVVVAMFALSGTFSRASERFMTNAQYHDFKYSIDRLRSERNLSGRSIILTPLNVKLEQLRSARRKDREQLLYEFAATKRKLDEMGRDLSFLAIDVVDSIGMKQNEERGIIEHDFKEYKRFVERTLTANGALKAAWTPDGVMSCFATVDAAVRAAREVITGLETFNRDMKLMKRDFTVRCGVNSGFVYYDDLVPLEEISDRVIDIAGHMQKHAQPNTLCIAKPTIEPLNDRIGFEPAGRVVDGYEVYEWRRS